MQVLREVNGYQLIERNGEFFVFDRRTLSFALDQETKNEFLKLSNDEFLEKVQQNVAHTNAVMMLHFYHNNL
jgi:hypothetical protein